MILNARDPATVITIREAEMIVKLFDIDGTEMDLEELMALHDMRRRLIGEIGETYRRRMEYEFNRAMERAWSERMEETTSSDRLTAATCLTAFGQLRERSFPAQTELLGNSDPQHASACLDPALPAAGSAPRGEGK